MVALEESTLQAPATTTLTLAVDSEHSGIRLAGCGSLIAAFFLTLLIVSQIPGMPFFIGVVVSAVVAVSVSYVAEKVLKERWPSGRVLHASPSAIAIHKQSAVERTVDPQQQVNVLAWHFKVERGSRVKKGWLVLGLSLEQEGEYVPVYAFASPHDFEKLPLAGHFQKLEKPNKNRDDKNTLRNMRQAGEQRRLHEAEIDRSYNGAEITFAQFVDYLEFLQKTYPRWMLS